MEMKKAILFLSMLLFLTTGFSQQLQRSPVGEKVQALKEKGNTFPDAQLFDRLPANKSLIEDLRDEVTNPVLLRPRAADLQQLLSEKPNTLSLTLQDPFDETFTLELYQVNITAPGFRVNLADGGTVDREIPMVHYRGIIRGEHHSLVSISIFENEVMGFISGAEGTMVLGKLKAANKANEHILYRERDLVDDFEFLCDTPDDGVVYTAEELAPYGGRNTPGCTNIFVEVDWDIFSDKGGVDPTVTYITGLFNQVAALYADLDGSNGGSTDGIPIAISEIKIWNIDQSPYSGSNSSSNLSAFQSSNGEFNGDLGIIVNYAISGGVAAGFSGLCNNNPDARMCAAGIDNSYSTIQTFSWSVMVCAHELGHLFGSRHTHACVWNGNGTAIDGCYRTEGRCRKAPIPDGGGTVMSYCHLQSVGINFAESFGPQPGNLIYNNVVGATNSQCLTTCGAGPNVVTVGDIPAHCSSGVQDGDETGVDCGGSCPEVCDTGGNGSCDPPTPVNTTSITNRTATMNWNFASGADSYVLWIREVGGGSYQDFPTTATSVSLQGFRNNRTYEWYVVSVCGGETSGNSAICTFVAGGASTQSCGGTLPAGLIEEEVVSFFPNPARDVLQVTVSLPDAEKVQVSIIDMMGRRVQGATLENGIFNQTIDVSGLTSGVYLLRVENGEKSFTEKVVIH